VALAELRTNIEHPLPPIFPRLHLPPITRHTRSQAISVSPPVHLAHRVSELFGCSRAEAEQYIRNGW
jgi:hypothetical protein